MANLNHWKTIQKFSSPAPTWISGIDADRVAAYDAYERMYWTIDDTFKVVMRGQEGSPIYVPSGRKIVETGHRYLATGFEVYVDPTFGDQPEQDDATLLIADFLKRERFYSRFSANKRDGLIKGDWLWYIVADPNRPEGSRLSLFPLDPATYFPEYADGDVDEIIAVHLADATLTSDGKPAVRKTSYIKETGTSGPSNIIYVDALYAPDEWGQPQTDMPLGTPIFMNPDADHVVLPSPIDHFPVYHIQNSYVSGDGWGFSEMTGIERIMTGINQAITDEELTLVLEGLGIYTTDAGAPIDEATGKPMPWNLGPARVVELPSGKSFDRITANTSVAPYQEHLGYLHQQLDDVTGANEAARGLADVQLAESGIALAIRMAPLLTRMSEKELLISDVMSNMFFDLRKWFAAFEGLNLDSVRFAFRYGDKLPVNKKQIFDEIMSMATTQPPIISTQEARRQLQKIGWDFPEDTQMWDEVLQEQQDFQGILADATATRINAEMNAMPPVEG